MPAVDLASSMALSVDTFRIIVGLDFDEFDRVGQISLRETARVLLSEQLMPLKESEVVFFFR